MLKSEFLEKVNNIYGNKYVYNNLNDDISYSDYLDIEYNGRLYKQRVDNHLIGVYPEKNSKKKTNEEFINEARRIYGDKYDYSLVDYKNANTKVKIIYKGVIFEQTPSGHYSKCPEGTWNKDYFIYLAKEVHGDKYDYSLVEYKNSKEKVKIIYDGVVYEQTPSLHLCGSPEKNDKLFNNLNSFIEKSIKVHGIGVYDYSDVVYVNNLTKVKIKCIFHNIYFETLPGSHINLGCGCSKCGMIKNVKSRQDFKYSDETLKKETEQFIENARVVWGDKYDYINTKYYNAKTKVEIIYDGISYFQLPNCHFKYPCESFLTLDIFLKRANKKWGNKYDYSLVDCIKPFEKVKIIYNGIVYEQLPENHIRYEPEIDKTYYQNLFVERSIKKYGNLYSYDKSKYETSREQLIVTCSKHGDFMVTPVMHLRSGGCPNCNQSIGERLIESFLIDNNISYVRQKQFDDCIFKNKLRFDFYIESHNLIIEFDGAQHFKPIDFFGGIEAFENILIRDEIKNDYCFDNDIDMLRISYLNQDKINIILNERLNKIYKMI